MYAANSPFTKKRPQPVEGELLSPGSSEGVGVVGGASAPLHVKVKANDEAAIAIDKACAGSVYPSLAAAYGLMALGGALENCGSPLPPRVAFAAVASQEAVAMAGWRPPASSSGRRGAPRPSCN
jgi:hypothetical protein